jgi:hypothetical protein
MKKSSIQSVLFNVRVLVGLVVVLAGIFLALLGLGAFSNALAQVRRERTTQQLEVPVSYERIEAASVSVIDFQKLAEVDEKAARSRPPNEPPVFLEYPPEEFPSPTPPTGAITGQEDFAALQPPVGALLGLPGQALIPSPQPSLNFLAQAQGALGYYPVPPDTMGAVGPDKLFVMLNASYRVQNKSTGAVLSEVSDNTFWSSTGTTCGGDPRVVFDPYNNRWLVSALSGLGESILVGISSTSDPQGMWMLFRFMAGASGQTADFDRLGFNKNWVGVAWNHSTGAQKLLLLDYPRLRAGTAAGTIITSTTYPNNFMPATTLSSTQETLYIPVQEDGGNALYRLHKITGTPSAPVLTFDTVSKVRPGGGWTGPDGDHMPQTCIGTPGVTCPVTPLPLDDGNDRVMNPVFRNGNIWYSQIIGLPANGWTHTAVQWTRINTSGAFVEGGRVEDPTATSSNGGEWYSQPSIAVNANNDVLLGFSNFSSAHLANAGYAFRFGTDAPGTMRTPVIFKQGEDYYHKNDRWGDYSHTVVDPANDLDMWTIQEYARMRIIQDAQQTSENCRWSTWWAKVCNPNVSYTIIANAGTGGTATGGGTYGCGSNVTLVAIPDSFHTFANFTEHGNLVGTFYEAESGSNTLAGGAVRQDWPWCSAGQKVGYVGNDAGTLQFNGVAAAAGAGSYRLTIYYVNGDPVVRTAYLSVNGAPGKSLSFPSTGGWSTVGSLQTNVNLSAGNSNTLRFYNPNSWAPDFDRIGVNARESYTFMAGANRTLVANFTPGPPSPPTANPATYIASNSFIANWSGVSGATGYRLDVSPSSSFSTYVPGYQNLNVGNAASRSVTSLNASTRYYYRVRAYNGAGTSANSNVVNVTTLTPSGPPVVISNPATSIASFSATLNGSVDPHGLTTTVYFQYGTTTSYGSTTASQTKSGNTYQSVITNVNGLSASTTYHFRIVATNSSGTRYGSDRTFTTLSATGFPVVITNPATNATSSSATLHGSLDPHGLTTTVYFEYGTTTSYGHTTPTQSQTGNTYRNISANISGLATHTTYHFRIVATNTAGTRYGSDRTFTTP